MTANIFTSETFFSEWDSKKYLSLFFLPTVLMILLLVWISTNTPQLSTQADIFFKFIEISIIFFVGKFALDFVLKENNPIGFLSPGKSYSRALIGFGLGALLSYFLFSFSFAVISTPLSAVQVDARVAAFLFSVIVAPYAEELLFRDALYPTLLRISKTKLGNFQLTALQAGIVSILLTCSAFAVFHLAVFSAGLNLMIAAFIFSLMGIIGNRLCETTYFSKGLHWANNFLVFGGIAALIGLI